MQAQEIKLNRFPKMMILQYVRAKKLGYSEEQAKAIGYAEAFKYAIFKTKRAYFSNPNQTKSKNKKGQQSLSPSELKVNEIFQLYFKKNMPYVGGKLIKEFDFEKELIKKQITQEVLSNIVEFYNRVLEKVGMGLIKQESKFFNKVWKVIRDLNPPFNESEVEKILN